MSNDEYQHQGFLDRQKPYEIVYKIIREQIEKLFKEEVEKWNIMPMQRKINLTTKK